MKITSFKCMGMALGVGVLIAFGPIIRADTFFIDVSSDTYTLYTDQIGNQIKLAGFSALAPVPGDRTGTFFFTVTDRGPNADYTNATTKFFPTPNYAPSIVTLHITGPGVAQIVNVLPLRKPAGGFVTGLPNSCLPGQEIALDLGLNLVPGDPDGLDTEGLTIDGDGNFWICEEYRPSICKVSPDGVVQFRLVPQGAICGDEQIPTFDLLPSAIGKHRENPSTDGSDEVPAVYKKRRLNRGFEGIAYQNGRIYAILQRPLMNPNAATGNTSRNIRILEINPAWAGTGRAVRQFLYVTEPNAAQASVYASDLYALNSGILLVPERKTDAAYAVQLRSATDITPFESGLGFLISDPTKTIEQLSPSQLAALGIKTAKKSVVIPSLTALDPTLEKCEGIAVVGRTVVLSPDNDFNIIGANTNYVPAALIAPVPANLPRLITTPLPTEIGFPE
jgi:hypothetical protein